MPDKLAGPRYAEANLAFPFKVLKWNGSAASCDYFSAELHLYSVYGRSKGCVVLVFIFKLDPGLLTTSRFIS